LDAEAEARGAARTEPEHLLVALVGETEGITREALLRLGIEPGQVGVGAPEAEPIAAPDPARVQHSAIS